MIRILKQKATTLLQLFFTSPEDRDTFRLLPFIAMVLLMSGFIACFIYIAIISHKL